MSTPGSPTSSPSPLSASALAAAAERRAADAAASNYETPKQRATQHEKRLLMNRMIDPGIIRPNSHDKAYTALKTLHTISSNLLREPENPKYQQFKTTNSIVKRDLVEVKGAIEFAVQMGFRAQVHDFLPHYVFHERHMDDLRMANEILQEFLDLEAARQTRASESKMTTLAMREAAVQKVKLAYLEDREAKRQLDERERQRRAVLEAAAAYELHRGSSEGTEHRQGSPEGISHSRQGSIDSASTDPSAARIRTVGTHADNNDD